MGNVLLSFCSCVANDVHTMFYRGSSTKFFMLIGESIALNVENAGLKRNDPIFFLFTDE